MSKRFIAACTPRKQFHCNHWDRRVTVPEDHILKNEGCGSKACYIISVIVGVSVMEWTPLSPGHVLSGKSFSVAGVPNQHALEFFNIKWGKNKSNYREDIW